MPNKKANAEANNMQIINYRSPGRASGRSYRYLTAQCTPLCVRRAVCSSGRYHLPETPCAGLYRPGELSSTPRSIVAASCLSQSRITLAA